ncbi:MAG: RNA-binding S4 domain-containing protein [Paracoccaceae bacterium]
MAGPGARPNPQAQPKLRIDRWLWQARFFRSRTTAAEEVSEGHVRLNGQRIVKPGHGIGAGDVLTFAQGGRIRLIRVVALGQRRGPSGEARGLYDDLDPLPESEDRDDEAEDGDIDAA